MYDFKNQALVICSSKVKEKILRENTQNKKLINIAFLSEHDLLEKVFFKITNKAYIEAMAFLHLSYPNSKIITKNIYYVDETKQYNDLKLDTLVALKKHLKVQGLLEYDPFFTNEVKRRSVYVLLPSMDNLTRACLTQLSLLTNVNYVPLTDDLNELTYQEFANYYDEVDYTFYEISNLAKNVKLDKIVIAVNDQSYYHILKRYSYYYKLPIDIGSEESILSSKEFKYFMEMIDGDNLDFKNLNKAGNEAIFAKIINIYNNFYFVKDKALLKEIMVTEAKEVKYDKEHLEGAIKVLSFDDSFNDDEYVFLLDFANGNIPKIATDDAYLGDRYAGIVPITTVDERNAINRIKAIKKLRGINHLKLSFSKYTGEEKVLSSLVQAMNITKIKGTTPYGVASLRDELIYATKMDDFYTYGVYDEALGNLNATFTNVYNSYDNQFDFVDSALLKTKIKNEINLSYSAVSDFFKCQFAYFLKNILRIYVDSDKSAAHLGTAYHAILENMNKENFVLEEEIEKQAATLLDVKEKFYFYKNIENVKTVFNFILEMRESTQLTDELHEQEICLESFDKDILCRFKGFVDKIIYKDIDGVTYLAIIDYKTGSDTASLEAIDLGFNLQLPVYAYLISKSNLFKNPQIIGVYLEPFMKLGELKSLSQTMHDIRWKASMLEGYTLNDPKMIALLDPTFTNSRYIKGLSYKDDFSRWSKIFSKEDLTAIIGLTERLINEAFISIAKGDFKINPKIVKEKNMSCTFCDYKDICYLKNRDFKRLISNFNLKTEKEEI